MKMHGNGADNHDRRFVSVKGGIRENPKIFNYIAKISKINNSKKDYDKVVQRPKPAPSSQSMRLEMDVDGALEPRAHLFFDLARPVASHALTKETVRLQGLLHFSESFFC